MNAAAVERFWSKLRRALPWQRLSPAVRRPLVAIVGGLVLLVGAAMLFLPGPAVLVIPLGVLILASEFSWARRWLHKTREYLRRRTGSSSRSEKWRRKRPDNK